MTGASLVIGATGLIGSALIRTLGSTAIPARIGWRDSDAEQQLRASIHQFFLANDREGPSRTVYWAAGRSVIASSQDTIDAEQKTFHVGLRCIAEVARTPTTLVLISSAGAIHTGTTEAAITESTTPAPPSSYGRMKVEQERQLLQMVESSGLRGLILRAPTVDGPGQDPTKQQGLVSALIRSARTSSAVSIFVPRDTRRHYVWSEDLGRIAAELVRNTRIGLGESAIRIVTTERSRTVDEVVSIVTRVVRRRPVVRFMATNHAPGHGLDLTLQSEFPPVWRTSGVLGLAEGVRRLVDDRGWSAREVLTDPRANIATAAGP